MGKDPALLWYPNDWTGGTGTYTRHLKGCYMDLLMAQFNVGHLSLEEIKTVLGADFGSWPALQKKFITDSNGFFFNERLELEKQKRIAFTESRRNNLKPHKEPQVKDHMAVHMENRNRNEIEVKSKKEVEKEIFGDEIFIANLESVHRGDLRKAFGECWNHHSNSINPPKELWEWKQKLNTWLSIGGGRNNGNNSIAEQRAAETKRKLEQA